MLRHEIGRHEPGGVHAKRLADARTRKAVEPGDGGEGHVVDPNGDRLGLALVRVLHREPPLGGGGLVGGRVVVIRADDRRGDRRKRIRSDRRGLPERGLEQLGLRLDVETGEGEDDVGPIPTPGVHRDLEVSGWTLTPRARDANAIGTLLAQLHRVESCRDVGAEIARRADLIEQLRRDRADRDRSPGAGMLGDDRRTVRLNLGDGKPGPFEAGDLGEEGVVPACRLRPALDDMAGRHCAGHGVPVVAGPAVMPGGRTGDDRSVGRAAGDDDVSAPVERFDNPPRAQIGVRRDVVDRGDRFARLEVEDVDASLP